MSVSIGFVLVEPTCEIEINTLIEKDLKRIFVESRALDHELKWHFHVWCPSVPQSFAVEPASISIDDYEVVTCVAKYVKRCAIYQMTCAFGTPGFAVLQVMVYPLVVDFNVCKQDLPEFESNPRALSRKVREIMKKKMKEGEICGDPSVASMLGFLYLL